MELLFPLPTFLLHVTPGSGAIEGFLHPILGVDHLLAMVTVGLLSAQLGGRAIWTVPLTFVVTMAVGAGLGILGVQIPLVEFGIAASVVVLGLALLLKAKLPELLAMVFVALFAVFHGWAHGAELPVMDNTITAIAYIVGFLVSTAGLHVVGALIGYILLRNERGAIMLRGAGLLIALAGIFIMTGLFTAA